MSGSPTVAVHVEPLLEAYHAGALPPEEAARIERHLRACAACRERSDAIAVYQIIRSTPTPSVGPELRQRVYARIAEAERASASEATGGSARAARLGLRDIGDGSCARRTRSQGARLGGAWVSGAVAALIVALLVSGFWALPRLRQLPNPASTATTVVSPPIIGPVACPASATSVKLPANTELSDMALTSPTEGWAVGSVMADQGYASQGVILRFSNCHWSPVAIDLTGLGLSQIAMDSPTDGWAIGNRTDSNAPALFHLSDGVWKQSPLPGGLVVAESYFAQVRAYAPGNIWITAFTPKNSQGQTGVMLLLHLMDGKWSSVACPLPILYTVAPVGPNELWLAGETSTVTEAAANYRFAHFKDGQWSVMLQPDGAELTTMWATSPTDVWASGYIPSSQAGYIAQPVVARYDGVGWHEAPQSIPPDSGAGVMSYALSATDSWAERTSEITPTPGTGPSTQVVSQVWREVGGQWRTLSWPYKDLSSLYGFAPVSSSEFWVIGSYNVEIITGTRGSSTTGEGLARTVLLHYANGVWTRYG